MLLSIAYSLIYFVRVDISADDMLSVLRKYNAVQELSSDNLLAIDIEGTYAQSMFEIAYGRMLLPFTLNQRKPSSLPLYVGNEVLSLESMYTFGLLSNLELKLFVNSECNFEDNTISVNVIIFPISSNCPVVFIIEKVIYKIAINYKIQVSGALLFRFNHNSNSLLSFTLTRPNKLNLE